MSSWSLNWNHLKSHKNNKTKQKSFRLNIKKQKIIKIKKHVLKFIKNTKQFNKNEKKKNNKWMKENILKNDQIKLLINDNVKNKNPIVFYFIF